MTCVGAIAIVAVAATPASGAYDPVGSGVVQLRLDPRFLDFLTSNGVRLEAVAPAGVRKKTFTLPIVGGSMDPTLGKGRADTEGALVFRNARRRVPLRDISVKTKRSPIVAKVGGGQLKVATAGSLRERRYGFGSVFRASKLRLTAKVATRLNKKLRPLLPFAAGQPIGATVARANPQTVSVLGANRVSLDLDPAFVAKLNSVFVSVNPIFPAERVSSFTFPILSGSTLSPDGSLGVLKTGGDVEFLQLHSRTQVFLHESWLDFGARLDTREVELQPSPPLGGKLGRIPTFDLQVGTTVADPRARTIAISGSRLILQPPIAQAFNDAFAEGKGLFLPGELIGAVSFTAQAQ